MTPPRRSLVVTRDGDLLHHVVTATKPATVEIRFDGHSAAEALKAADFALVVLDDEALTESERGWLIDESRRLQPEVPIVYVAAKPSAASERMASCHRVSCYAAKPIDRGMRSRIRGLVSRRRPTAEPPPERNTPHADPTHLPVR